MPSGICILLSTFNGESFLAEQIDSIRHQTYQDWRLLIRDDASSDGTLQIVEKFQQMDPRISILESDSGRNLGAAVSYSILIEAAIHSGAEYFFLADQDDYWLPDKVELLMQQFAGAGGPLLLFSDYQLTDEQLSPIKSDRLFDRFARGSTGPAAFLSLNWIPGCCMAFNRELAELAVPVPDCSPMHDWWLALTAAVTGTVRFVDQILVKYRQHQKNAIGAASISSLLRGVGRWPSLWRDGQEKLRLTVDQADTLLARLSAGHSSATADRASLAKYAGLLSLNGFQRLQVASILGLRKEVPIVRALLLARLIALPRAERASAGSR